MHIAVTYNKEARAHFPTQLRLFLMRKKNGDKTSMRYTLNSLSPTQTV